MNEPCPRKQRGRCHSPDEHRSFHGQRCACVAGPDQHRARLANLAEEWPTMLRSVFFGTRSGEGNFDRRRERPLRLAIGGRSWSTVGFDDGAGVSHAGRTPGDKGTPGSDPARTGVSGWPICRARR
jgi:hypothetical protein